MSTKTDCSMLDPITCILILDHKDNTQYYVPLADYQSNPTLGTVVLKERAAIWEPVVKEKDDYWLMGTVKSNIPKQSTRMTTDQVYQQMLKEQIEMRRKRENWFKERGK
jgi:hypothetical protein